MKKGFTLAELLITMGIIGIAAAILAPMVGNIIPDGNKGKVLKVYNNVSKINEEILNDPSLYVGENGLSDTSAPADPNFASYSGSSKYGKLLANRLEIDGNISDNGTTVSFKTTDGISWTVATDSIVVDVNPETTTNCYYGQSGCKTPDVFKFKIDESGNLSGDDPLTKAYLANPERMNDKKKDFDYAKELS